MQTSYNTLDWREHPGDEQQRMRLIPTSPHAEKRALFPLSARLVKPSMIYDNLPEGHVFMYARTKLTPAAFPIEVLHWTEQGYRKYHCFRPDEVEILPPQD